MDQKSRGRDLFIVDNSVSGWTGLRYLEEWTSIAKGFDIATGHFEIGALLALDGKWQQLEKIRILMGAETTHRTRKAILDVVRKRAIEVPDNSIEADKETNPFLKGVPAILEALQSGRIECRVYDRAKFHAKAYITHAKLEVVGSQALVGSSNFSAPGLTKNIELNVQIQSAREVAQLQEWFEAHWKEATEVTEALIETISRHTRLYSPFDVYAEALQEFFRGHELTATEWDETRSKMFPKIDLYQKEAYWALMKIARQHGGAFLCDGVGLGKTFVGLMLIERLVLHEGKRVVLFAPKATKEGVWEPHLREWLPHIGGVGGGADFSNLAVFSHTDLGRKGEFPERFKRIAELAGMNTMPRMLCPGSEAIVCASRLSAKGFEHALAARSLCVHKYSSHDINSRMFLIAYGDLNHAKGRLSSGVRSEYLARLLFPHELGELEQAKMFGAYVLAILNAPSYRNRYYENIYQDFPRVPLPRSATLLSELAIIGVSLGSAFCLSVQVPIGRFLFRGCLHEPCTTPKLEDRDLWIGATSYIEEVSQEVWEFKMAGYQVCSSWFTAGGHSGLARKGNELSKDFIEELRKVLFCVEETIRLQAAADEIIEAHGGWPGAFQSSASADAAAARGVDVAAQAGN